MSHAFGARYFALNILCLRAPFNETQQRAWCQEESKLKALKVPELNKYLRYLGLMEELKSKKAAKVKAIRRHHIRQEIEETEENRETERPEEAEDEEMEDEELEDEGTEVECSSS